MLRIIFIVVLVSCAVLTRPGHAVVSVYDSEAAFILDISHLGYMNLVEDFESAAWDHVRSMFPNHQVAPSVTHQGLTWLARPGNAITTNTNWGRTGWGIYEFQNSPISSSQILGSSAQTVYGVGGWVNTNPDGGEIVIEIDGVSHDGTPVGSGHAFYGVIDTEGFTTFRVYDLEGHTVWGADDFTFAVAPPACDFDGDGNCNLTDLNQLLAEGPIAPGVPVTAGVNDQFDLTGDGVINNDDADRWLDDAATNNGFGSPYQRGDANLDGVVDGSDFGCWNSNKFASTLRWDNGNFDGNAVTDGSDFGFWNANKFTSSQRVSGVPEPSLCWLILVVVFLRLKVARGDAVAGDDRRWEST